ncbi:MAG: YybS family protein [Peptoniphilus sp.]|uniref:DUF2232 domain-containing protein n=1 Tax=Peptoniphilus sp. TaxID=1971214 RepID=UPI0025FF6A99|nr:DUF2232 domain-containing protein [Peptoniphilus sp.]MCI5643873.1 YybS family protein [Peptoniphilus sp.]MDD7353092.1 DUF2232 domain-containing protein [Peptoniphilaceae bacterium]MDY3902185.1 DUF2232 domain-containing protein [Peptoniphilus sp.]
MKKTGVDLLEKETDFKGLFRLFTRSIIISMIGMIFPFFYILFPSMYVVESVKEGIMKVMATLIAVVLLIAALLGPIYAIIIFTIFGPFILIFHYMISTNRPVSMTIMATSFIFFTSIMVLFFAFGVNSDVLNSRETINAITSFYTNIAKEAGLSQGDLSNFTQSAEIYYKRFLQILPSVLIVISLVTSYVTYTTAGRTLLSKGKFILQPSSLEFLKFPREIIMLSIATVAIFSLTGEYFGSSGQIFMLNLMNLIYFMLFVAGISVIKFFMTRFGFKNFLQYLLIGLCLTISSLQIFVMIIGAIDQIVNFRKIN